MIPAHQFGLRHKYGTAEQNHRIVNSINKDLLKGQNIYDKIWKEGFYFNFYKFRRTTAKSGSRINRELCKKKLDWITTINQKELSWNRNPLHCASRCVNVSENDPGSCPNRHFCVYIFRGRTKLPNMRDNEIRCSQLTHQIQSFKGGSRNLWQTNKKIVNSQPKVDHTIISSKDISTLNGKNYEFTRQCTLQPRT